MEGVIDAGRSFSLDPQYCGPNGPDYEGLFVRESSPCAPGHHPDGADCGMVGWGEPGCEPINPVEVTTWGRIKAMYKDATK